MGGSTPRRRRAWLHIAVAALVAGRARPFVVGPPGARPPTALAVKLQRKWANERKTLADKVAADGGGSDAASKGIVGDVDVIFRQGNATKATKAIVGQPLTEVATNADQFIRYKCKKGECGTCEVQVDGKWVRSCVTTIPYVDPGHAFEVTVKPSMVARKKSSRFYSVKSILDGWVNNILGMVGFVRTSAREGKNFRVRIDRESEIAAKVAAKKAARRAAREKQGA